MDLSQKYALENKIAKNLGKKRKICSVQLFLNPEDHFSEKV